MSIVMNVMMIIVTLMSMDMNVIKNINMTMRIPRGMARRRVVIVLDA